MDLTVTLGWATMVPNCQLTAAGSAGSITRNRSYADHPHEGPVAAWRRTYTDTYGA